ncbi:MAG TPA: hypothetical protein VGR02_03705 [Thermoanaerobaculia bacterium]|jgi:hypothetical protein|nr:hypothetical protein [Thermoanaerobaculia bacterium]
MDSSTPGSPYVPPPPPSVPGGGDLVYPTQPPKDPILIMILNLLVAGGLGYIIMGQKTKGIVFIVVSVVTCGFAAIILAPLGAVDGYMQAQHLQAGYPVGQWTFFNDHR